MSELTLSPLKISAPDYPRLPALLPAKGNGGEMKVSASLKHLGGQAATLEAAQHFFLLNYCPSCCFPELLS